MFNDLKKLKDYGFSGFHTVGSLMHNQCENVPKIPGVYMVLSPDQERCFLETPVGSQCGKRFTVAEVCAEWVDDTIVNYIGKTERTLQERIKEYMRFGQGRGTNHKGGRLIWYLKNHQSLLICYRNTPSNAARELEKRLICEFKQQYDDKRPFANLKD